MTHADAPAPAALHRRRALGCRSVADLRRAAHCRLPRGVFDFIDGGAEDERTLSGNAAAFAQLRFKPRTLVDVTSVDLTARVLGQIQPLPLVVGPTGAAGFAWPRGDAALLSAAAEAGIPFAQSTSASVSIEDLAQQAEARRWFQCYIFRQHDFTHGLIQRARRAGCEALVITVDLPVGGNRERDHRNHFSIPFRYTPRNVLDFARHPEWALSMLWHGRPELANLDGFTASNDLSTVASSVGRNYDAGFDWDDLRRIRDLWKGRLIVKGIARPEEARRLADIGVDAVVVSNHGGRQLDGALPTLECLPEIAHALRGRAEVYLDGGVRRGADVVKALCLGADAVLLGRVGLYGLAVAGQAGAARAIAILQDETRRVMQLCGAQRLSDLTPDLIAAQDLARLFGPDTAQWLASEADPFGRTHRDTARKTA